MARRDGIDLGIVNPLLFTSARVESVHEAVVHGLVDRVVPHQRRTFGAPAASRRCERRRPSQAQLADVRFIDLLQLAITLFGLFQPVSEPRARQSVLGGTRGSENFSVDRAWLLSDNSGNENKSGDDSKGPQDGLFDVEGSHDVIPSITDEPGRSPAAA